MGDVAMTVPVIKAFTEQNPDVKITFLSRAFLKPLFDDIPNVQFYTADVNNTHKGITGIYKLFKELKKEKIDGVVDLHNVLRSKILGLFFKLSGVKTEKIDKGRAEKKALTNPNRKVFKQLLSTHERYVHVFQKMGFKLDINNPKFSSPQKLTQEILKLTGDISPHTKLIGIAPFAQHASKTYPIDLIETVLEKLSSKKDVKVILFGGGAKEVEALSTLDKKYKNSICVAGKLKLKEELTLISNLNCMVSMDSGNGHFSAMLGVPTITLWGVTHPYAGFSPYNQPEENRLLPDLKKYPNIPCSIYGNKVCLGYEDVMRTITPDTVVAAIELKL